MDFACDSCVAFLWVRPHSLSLARLCPNVTREVCRYLHSRVDALALVTAAGRCVVTDIRTGQSLCLAEAVPMPLGAVLCLYDWKSVLRVGAVREAILIGDCTWRATGQMKHSQRLFPGALKLDAFVYVFGGAGAGCLLSSEKYNADSDSWESLPTMRYPKVGFSPCRYGYCIILPEVNHCPALFEVYNTVESTFKSLQLGIPLSGGFSVSFIQSDTLFVFTSNSELWISRLSSQSWQRVSVPSSGYHSYSQCPPVVVGRKGYFVDYHDLVLCEVSLV